MKSGSEKKKADPKQDPGIQTGAKSKGQESGLQGDPDESIDYKTVTKADLDQGRELLYYSQFQKSPKRPRSWIEKMLVIPILTAGTFY